MRKIIFIYFAISFLTGCDEPVPGILKVVQDLPADQAQEAADRLLAQWTDAGQVPYIQGDTAIFLLKQDAQKVALAGDMNQWQPDQTYLDQLADTDLWYYIFPTYPDARLDYKFVIDDGSWILDPRNPRRSDHNDFVNSELRMPEYQDPLIAERDSSVQMGKLDTLAVDTNRWTMIRSIVVYKPAAYEALESMPSAYFHDGLNQVAIADVPVILDNLIAQGTIPPAIAIFVEPKDRSQAYAFEQQSAFARFFVEELVPYIDEKYKTSRKGDDRATIGASFGGLISVVLSFTYPEVFGNCGAHSCAYWPNKRAGYELILSRLKEPVKYAAIWGSYDGVRSNNNEVVRHFENEGIPILHRELHEGHTWALWRATTSDFLQYFFGSDPN